MNEAPVVQIFNESGEDIPLSEKEANAILPAFCEKEHCHFSFVELVYVDENEIVRINKEHLDRDYITDIISFRYDENTDNREIEGTLFCCAPRIKEQAQEFAGSEKEEFQRILIHGLLHLVGYNDATAEEKNRMTALENHYLNLM